MLFEMQKQTNNNNNTRQNKTKQHKNKFNQGTVLFYQEGGWWFSGGWAPERKWHIEGGIPRKCHFERGWAHNRKKNH